MAVTDTLITAAGTYNAPKIVWNPSAELQAWSSKAAFLLMVIWVIYIAAQYVLPSKRSQGMRGQTGKLIATGAFCILLLDLKLLPTLINNILKIFWYMGGLIGLN